MAGMKRTPDVQCGAKPFGGVPQTGEELTMPLEGSEPPGQITARVARGGRPDASLRHCRLRQVAGRGFDTTGMPSDGFQLGDMDCLNGCFLQDVAVRPVPGASGRGRRSPRS